MVDLLAGAPNPAVPVPPVFQEVTFEGPTHPTEGTKRRGLVTTDHHVIWNWLPDNTTECYDRARDPGEQRDLWGSVAGAACVPLKQSLQDLVQTFSWPLDLGEKLAQGVFPYAAKAPAPTHPADVRLGTAVRFAGYDLTPASVERKAGEGGEIEVVYHFDVRERIPAGYRPFFHLDGPSGVINVDHAPLDGAYPVERWRPGQRIRDRQRIVIPAGLPAGSYTIHVGLFRGGDRLPVFPSEASDGRSRLRVVTFSVR
jgi:lipoteichoic acid synthase